MRAAFSRSSSNTDAESQQVKKWCPVNRYSLYKPRPKIRWPKDITRGQVWVRNGKVTHLPYPKEFKVSKKDTDGEWLAYVDTGILDNILMKLSEEEIVTYFQIKP